MFDLDRGTDLLASAGRDRRITFWQVSSAQQLSRVDEAHARLITCIRLKGSIMASSSRDHSVKVWQLGPATDFSHQVIQTLSEHAHSVWAVDLNDSFLVSGGQDKKVRIWRKVRTQLDDGESVREDWEKQCEMEDHHAGIRNLLLLRGHPHLCLTGDIYGDLRVWNAIERRMQYHVPEQDDMSWFSHSGAVTAISQCARDQGRGRMSGDFLAVAFGSHRVVLYDATRAEQRLDLCRVIHLEPLVGTAILRTVIATPVEIYLSTFSGKHGIIVLDIWDEDEEE